MAVDHSGKILKSGVLILRKTGNKDSSGKSLYIQKCPLCGNTFEARYLINKKSCGCHLDHSGEVLESGIEITSKTNKRDVHNRPLFLMKCFCGEVFESFYNTKRVSCGCLVDHSGEVLESGIEILEKLNVKDEYNAYMYKQKCPVCSKSFEGSYIKGRKSCGCQYVVDHSGEVLESGIEILEKSNVKDENDAYMYKQKCPVCSKIFEGSYSKERKSCGCQYVVDHSGEVLESGIEILEKLNVKDEHNAYMYRQICPVCSKIFEGSYFKKRITCGCKYTVDHSGEVLESGIEILEKLDVKANDGKYMYRQKCSVCSKIFEGSYSKEKKSCGCLIDHSGEVLESGIEILEKSNVKDENDAYMYKQKCPVCSKIFEGSYSKERKSCGCLNSFDNLESVLRFGTNISILRRNDIDVRSNNTSGYTGVSRISSKNKWLASCSFQGYTIKKVFSTFEEAVECRVLMKSVHDNFLDWYDSLSVEEKHIMSKDYKNEKLYFNELFKSKINDVIQLGYSDFSVVLQ